MNRLNFYRMIIINFNYLNFIYIFVSTSNSNFKITKAFETMKEFNPRHDLQVALLSMFTHRLVVREAQEELAEVFSAMDLDADGVISEQDFTKSFALFYRAKQTDRRM